MDNGDNNLFDLLSEPLVPDRQPHSHWLAWVAGGVVVAAIVTITALLISDETRPEDEQTLVASTGATDQFAVATPGTDAATTPTTAFQYPGWRIHAGMATDPRTQSAVLLGGRQGSRVSPITDVWVRDQNGDWRALSPTLEPPGRELPAMVYVDSIDRVVVIGGSPTPTFGCGRWTFVVNPIVDVWMLDTAAGQWERPVHTNPPPDRWGHAVAYDANADKVVLFGGIGTDRQRNLGNLLGDTWLYDPHTGEWEPVATSDGPSPRACHGLVYDPTSQLVYLWGGQTESSSGDPTLWSFNTASGTWSEVLTESELQPEARWLHQLVYEPETDLIYVLGGLFYQTESTDSGSTTAQTATDEVWALNVSDRTWEQRSPIQRATAAHAAAADGQGNIVIFLGASTVIYNATEDRWTDVTPYELLDADAD